MRLPPVPVVAAGGMREATLVRVSKVLKDFRASNTQDLSHSLFHFYPYEGAIDDNSSFLEKSFCFLEKHGRDKGGGNFAPGYRSMWRSMTKEYKNMSKVYNT
ncbi:hypothetical protein GUJ93_ZPchr0001g31492 [Zizania palustris]|uniref:Uncharacterized protein n=1 Tax=Zizania palustris TaxID=103762 RepID=A0A8J5V7H4_ZIZPA|nr:hypothetical protein GUJ93_ZPchr0001g31492 [Zizania palustris]